jgi:nucleotide-binding universal stress UspA family protein
MGEPRIVVGVDGSPASFGALRAAVEEAKFRQIPLHIVVAWQLTSPEIATETPSVVRQIVRHNEQILEDALNAFDEYDSARVFVSGELVNSEPSAALLTAAEGSALLVVGSSGTSDRPEPYLGAVAHEVLRHAPCPVLLVPTTAA